MANKTTIKIVGTAHAATMQAPGIAEAVTVHTPISLGGVDLFAVQGGVPLSEAMDAMSLLLSTTETAANEAAISGGSDSQNHGTVWAIQHLLQMAQALNSSIHSGLMAAQRGDHATTSGEA